MSAPMVGIPHEGVSCSGCRTAIVGDRFLCGNCAVPVSFCSSCADRSLLIHSDRHCFIRVRLPLPHSDEDLTAAGVFPLFASLYSPLRGRSSISGSVDNSHPVSSFVSNGDIDSGRRHAVLRSADVFNDIIDSEITSILPPPLHIRHMSTNQSHPKPYVLPHIPDGREDLSNMTNVCAPDVAPSVKLHLQQLSAAHIIPQPPDIPPPPLRNQSYGDGDECVDYFNNVNIPSTKLPSFSLPLVGSTGWIWSSGITAYSGDFSETDRWLGRVHCVPPLSLSPNIFASLGWKVLSRLKDLSSLSRATSGNEFSRSSSGSFSRFDNTSINKNACVSPVMISSALACVANGATGDSLRQLMIILLGGELALAPDSRIGLHEINLCFQSLYDSIVTASTKGESQGVIATFCQGLFVSPPEGLLIRREYNKIADIHYASIIRPMHSAASVNLWTSNATNGLVHRVLDGPLTVKDYSSTHTHGGRTSSWESREALPLGTLAVVTAATMTGSWASPFVPRTESIEIGPWWCEPSLSSGMTTGKRVHARLFKCRGRFAYHQDSYRQLLLLPFGNGSDGESSQYAAMIILPRAGLAERHSSVLGLERSSSGSTPKASPSFGSRNRSESGNNIGVSSPKSLQNSYSDSLCPYVFGNSESESALNSPRSISGTGKSTPLLDDLIQSLAYRRECFDDWLDCVLNENGQPVCGGYDSRMRDSYDSGRNATNHIVHVILPCFSLECGGDLSDHVAALGGSPLFSPSAAELDGLSETHNLVMTNFFHHSVLCVNEKGISSVEQNSKKGISGITSSPVSSPRQRAMSGNISSPVFPSSPRNRSGSGGFSSSAPMSPRGSTPISPRGSPPMSPRGLNWSKAGAIASQEPVVRAAATRDFEFHATRPFLFSIVHLPSRALLFAGRVDTPTAYNSAAEFILSG